MGYPIAQGVGSRESCSSSSCFWFWTLCFIIGCLPSLTFVFCNESFWLAHHSKRDPNKRKHFEVSPTQQISFCWKMECLLYVPRLICEKQRTLGKADEIEACCYSNHLGEAVSDSRKSTNPNALHIPPKKEPWASWVHVSRPHWLVTILIWTYVFHHFRPTLIEGKGSMVKGGQRLPKHMG